MRAVHIYPTYVRSLAEGITRNVHDLCRALDRTSVDVRLDAPRVDLDDLNAHTAHLTKGWEAHRRALEALRDPDVDVVHYHVGVALTGVMARLARARAETDTPLVLHVWNAAYMPAQVHGKVGLLPRATHRLLNGIRPAQAGVNGADALVLPSDFQARQLSEHVDDRPLGVIPNGVDTERFSPALPRARGRARQDFDVHGHPTVLYYGHLSPWKGADTLLDALPAFFEQHPEARLLLAHTSYGNGGDRVRSRLEELGVREHVRLVGVTSVPRLHAAADVAVLPTVSPVGTACYPNVLLECMSAGLPVVASRVGSIPEVVDDGVNGVLVPPGEPSAIAGALSGLIDDPRRRRRIGYRAREETLERFRWGRIAANVEAFYDRILDEDDPEAPDVQPSLEVAP